MVLECKKPGNETVEQEIPIAVLKKKTFFFFCWPEISSSMSMSNERTTLVIITPLNSQNRIGAAFLVAQHNDLHFYQAMCFQ